MAVVGLEHPLHIFQGRADKFLNPLPNGVEDLFLTGTLKVSGVKVDLAYHDFQSNKNSINYGNEVDLIANFPFAKYYSLFVGGAYYKAKDFATDTTKVWVMFTADFK